MYGDLASFLGLERYCGEKFHISIHVFLSNFITIHFLI